MKHLRILKAEKHPKGWGEEIWIINTDKYCGKLLKFNKGDVVHIPPTKPHQLHALEASVVIEVSTPHDEADSYRIGKGDSQRDSQKSNRRIKK